MKQRYIVANRNRFGVLLVAAIATAAVAGCEQKSTPETRKRALETRTHQPSQTEAATISSGTEADGPVGVAACDEWVKKYLVCIDGKAPEAARAQMKVAIGQTKSTWRRTAQTAEGRAALATACSRMVESTRLATASFGCEW